MKTEATLEKDNFKLRHYRFADRLDIPRANGMLWLGKLAMKQICDTREVPTQTKG